MLNNAIKDIAIPARMARLPVNERGYPVPWFVAMIDGKWDFRAIGPGKVKDAYNKKLCWLCGQPLGQFLAFVIGPMCSINRVSSEPPSHRDCAEYAVKACPFLAQPKMRRNEKDMPAGTVMGGVGIMHNPGAILIWITKNFRPISDGRGGVLFEVGPPLETLWFTEGRTASRDEIEAAINKGLPLLRNIAEKDGIGGKIELEKRYSAALKLLPAE
jgi:hypothetical protein